MIKKVYIAVLSLLVLSCGGGGDDPIPNPIPTPVNKVPTTPGLVTPTNNKLCIDNAVQFEWNASTDPEGDVVNCELQIATNNAFSQGLITKISTNTSISVTLNKGIAYYWRVKAKDNENASSSYSSTFSFYTEGNGESNHLPFSPSIITPTFDATIQGASTTLEWSASDVDTDDILKFDVYFGTTNPPTSKISENQSGLTLNVNSLTPASNYYWYVKVKDDKGGQTIGQVWSFKTN